MNHASKVGLLVVAFVGLLLGAYATLGKSLFEAKTVDYVAEFTDAGGVVAGSTVALSGVQIGSVKSVKLVQAGKAHVTLAVNPEAKIPVGTQAVLATSLVGIGDRPVELVPPAKYTTMLKPGDTIPGAIKGPLEGLIPDTTETMSELNLTLKATRGLLEDQQLRKKFETLLDSTNVTVAQFGSLAGKIDRMVGENQSTFKTTLLNANKIMVDVSKTSAALARVATDGKLEGKTLALMDDMSATIKKSQGLIADLQSKVNDPEMNNAIKGILADTKTMTDSGTRIAKNTEEMTTNGIELSKKAIEIAEKASKLADQMSDLLKKADGAVGTISNLGKGSGGLGSVELDARFIRETDPGRFRAEVEAGFKFGDEKLYLGLWDALEGNKLIAQLARPVNEQMEIRYGVYASQLGLGVQYRLAPGVYLRGDLFDVNEPRMDLRARFELKKGLNAWVGFDKVFSRTSPTIGIGIRR